MRCPWIPALLCLATTAGAEPAGECAAPPQPVAGPESALLEAANALRATLEAGELEGREAELARLAAEAARLADPALRARVWIHLGRSAALLSHAGGSAGSALLATALYSRAEEGAGEAGDQRLVSYARGYRGELYERAGRNEEALALTRSALFAAAEATAADALYRWQWQVGRIRRAQGHEAEALEAYRQAVKSLEALSAAVALGAAEAALAFRSEVEPVYLGLVDLLLSRSGGVADDGERQALLSEARDSLEGLKAAELRDYYRDECLDAGRKTSPDTVPGAVVVYPILLPDRVELVVGRDGRLTRYRAPVDGGTLEAEVRRFRQLLTKRTTRQYRPLAERLYDWLIRPIEPSLGAGVEALVFVPGGALHTVPMAALRDRDTGRYLIERFPLAVTPGLTLTEPRALDRERVELLAAGISESVQGYPGLPQVASELTSISQSFPGVRLQDRDFQAERFESEVGSRPFEIVHVASHGEFSSESADSYLLTWDGRISMQRLAALVGRTRFRDERPLELLTLSACQTAEGDDRAALGLAGVAVRAGARSVLGTLWSVSDEATARLVGDFYAGLARPGTSRAAALQQAQTKLLRERAFRHPAFWSPFLLISSWL